jgi:zinc protease
VSLDKVEHSIDRVLRDLRENGITQAELDRAKRQFLAEFVYESDSQESLARRYGGGLALGMTVEDINRWPETIAQVTLDDVRHAAKHFDIRHSVTGTLVPVNAEQESVAAPAPAPSTAGAPAAASKAN